MSDDELEQVFRVGLQRHADDADTSVDLVRPARTAARTGRRRRAAAVGAVGLAAAALVTAVVVRDPGPGGADHGRNNVADSGPEEPTPTAWRTETWHGLSVEVPADWGWGVTPTGVTPEHKTGYFCGGPGAVVKTNGSRQVNARESQPWVGRPVMASDACVGFDRPSALAAYVWLGAAIEPGTVDAGNGYTQETVEVAGSTLTVATRDPELRQRIIGSAGPADDSCATSLDSPPVVDGMLTEGLRDPSSAQVCAYRHDEGAHTWKLVYATTLDAANATRYYSQAYDGGFESSPDFCGSYVDERVLITVTGDDPYGSEPVSQATVVDPFCREVSGSPGLVSPLSEKGMAAWSSNGAQVTLYGLIGPMG